VHHQTFTLQGRQVSPDDLVWLENWIVRHPHDSRKRLAHELCQLWHWHDDRGRLKDFAARSFLLKLATQDVVIVPPAGPVGPIPKLRSKQPVELKITNNPQMIP
jgi:hypothetical protein